MSTAGSAEGHMIKSKREASSAQHWLSCSCIEHVPNAEQSMRL